MSLRIRVLDEITINQIAAGEVIENPSSVVKEFIENSLDAGATDICVEIRWGGRQLIRVTDNGCGMSRDDALLCLERHATSKLKRLEDLSELKTMGFRGEAIPSIASISKFSLLTRLKEPTNAQATMLRVEGGKILECSLSTRDPGTTIEAKELFYNVPVRKKFQKSPTIDQNEILRGLIAQSLANPSLSFCLIADQNKLLQVPSVTTETSLEAIKERVQEILGEEFLRDTIAISIEKGPYKIEGFIGTPTNTRPNKQGQYLFLNKRPIVSPFISFAIRDGYATALPNMRYPVFVLHLTCPSELFDVNVHPQKKEVRFRKEEQLKYFLIQSVEAALQRKFSFSAAQPLDDLPDKSFSGTDFATFSLPEMNYSLKQPHEVQPTLAFCSASCIPPRVMGCLNEYALLDRMPEDFSEARGLCLMDLNGAFSRVLYERTLSVIKGQKCNFQAQALLIPFTIHLNPEEAHTLKVHGDLLAKMGFETREFAPNSFFIESIPEPFTDSNAVETVRELIMGLKLESHPVSWQNDRENQLALAAAKAAKYIKKPLSLTEAQNLLKELLRCAQPFFSPFSHPTIAVISFTELEKYFKKR